MDRIRSGIIVAAALTMPAIAFCAIAMSAMAVSTTSAKADEWCGYASHEDAVVECGYTTVAGCESAVGKGGMCFVDPDVAFNARRGKPSLSSKIPTRS